MYETLFITIFLQNTTQPYQVPYSKICVKDYQNSAHGRPLAKILHGNKPNSLAIVAVMSPSVCIDLHYFESQQKFVSAFSNFDICTALVTICIYVITHPPNMAVEKKPYVEPTLQNHENSMHQISQTWKVIDINLQVICYINNLYVSRTLDF